MATTTTAAPAATTTAAAAADTKVAATTAGSATRMMGEYEIGVTLGKGLQGKVKLGTHVKTGEKVALKMIDKAKIKPGSREKKCLEREVSIMEKLSHDNIVTLKKVEWDAVYPKRDGTSQEVILLVLELATGGELFDFMMYTGSFPEGIARAYFQQLMAGLKHCHGHKVAHRDLKPENLLLTSAFGLKVADFGLSALSEDGEGKPVLLRTQCGTRGYMAPEVLARRPYDGYAADVWSCGVILFIMLAGFPPFQLASSSDWWFQRIRNKQYKLFWEAHLRVATISAGAQKLLTKIFNADPKSRATMEEIEADEWYNASAITQATLTAELQRRMKAVQDQKRAEREAEERKRAAAAAAAGGATFDPFAREVHRAVKTAGADSDVPAPPLPASVFPRYTRFYTRERPKDITDRLAQTFSVMSADYKTAAAPYKLKASINTTTGQPVELSAAVFRTDDGLHVVDFLRRQGDLFKFQQVYKAVCEAMKDVICVPPSDDATTATDAAATAATDADATTAATGGGAGGGAGTTSAAAAVMM